MNYQRSSHIAVAVSTLTLCAAVPADVGDQFACIQPKDSTAGAGFGIGITMNGDLILVGAPNDVTALGQATGSAYVFSIAQPFFPIELAKIVPDDGAAGDRFGLRVALHGDVAYVGAHRDDDNGTDSGSVYLFDISEPGNPIQIMKLWPGDAAAGDQFGHRLALYGNTLLVGAYRDDDNGTDSGSVYLFDVTNPAAPDERAEVYPDDAAPNDWFGTFEAGNFQGDIVIIGATRDDDNGADSGSAYLFDISDPVNPNQLFKLLAKDGAAGDEFGQHAALSGGLAVVGAQYDSPNGGISGSAYIFDISDPENPVEVHKLVPDDGAPFDFYGCATIRGNLAVVGSPRDDDNGTDSGSAYFYDVTDPETPVLVTKETGDDAPGLFGNEIVLSGGMALVKAQFANNDAGAVYLLEAFPAFPACPADLDGDGDVSVSDLIAVIGGWGTPAGDVDGDGTTDVADLVAVITAWGPCG